MDEDSISDQETIYKASGSEASTLPLSPRSEAGSDATYSNIEEMASEPQEYDPMQPKDYQQPRIPGIQQTQSIGTQHAQNTGAQQSQISDIQQSQNIGIQQSRSFDFPHVQSSRSQRSQEPIVRPAPAPPLPPISRSPSLTPQVSITFGNAPPPPQLRTLPYHAKSAPNLYRQGTDDNSDSSDSSQPAPKTKTKKHVKWLNWLRESNVRDECIYEETDKIKGAYDFSTMFALSRHPKLPKEVVKVIRLIYYFCYQFVYYSLSLVIGAMVTIVFGIIVGIISFLNAWVFSAIIRIADTLITDFSRIFKSFVQHCCLPFFDAMANIFSKISLTRKDARHSSIRNSYVV